MLMGKDKGQKNSNSFIDDFRDKQVKGKYKAVYNQDLDDEVNEIEMQTYVEKAETQYHEERQILNGIKKVQGLEELSNEVCSLWKSTALDDNSLLDKNYHSFRAKVKQHNAKVSVHAKSKFAKFSAEGNLILTEALRNEKVLLCEEGASIKRRLELHGQNQAPTPTSSYNKSCCIIL
jgi:hypothetical protein